MALIFWDASAVAKRYAVETGSETVDAIFARRAAHVMVTTSWGFLETYSILLRRRNGGVLDAPTFRVAVTALQDEVVDDSAFRFLPVPERNVFSGLSLMQRHNLNATDAALLATLLDLPNAWTIRLGPTLLVTADRRLVRAGQQEGIALLNPEETSPGAVDDMMSRLP